jgi:hypothetical protein
MCCLETTLLQCDLRLFVSHKCNKCSSLPAPFRPFSLKVRPHEPFEHHNPRPCNLLPFSFDSMFVFCFHCSLLLLTHLHAYCLSLSFSLTNIQYIPIPVRSYLLPSNSSLPVLVHRLLFVSFSCPSRVLFMSPLPFDSFSHFLPLATVVHLLHASLCTLLIMRHGASLSFSFFFLSRIRFFNLIKFQPNN